MANDPNNTNSSNATPSQGERPWWRRKRYIVLLVLLVGLPVFLVARHIPKYLDNHTEQDQCEFGTGSTALYEGLRAEAEAYLEEHGRAKFAEYSSLASRDFSVALIRQLEDFAMTKTTPPERWASIHALLRAYGMKFNVNGPRDPKDLEPETVHLSVGYIVLLPKLSLTCPLCYVFPEATFSFSITNRGDGVYNQLPAGGLRIRSLNPTFPRRAVHYFHQTCPQVLK